MVIMTDSNSSGMVLMQPPESSMDLETTASDDDSESIPMLMMRSSYRHATVAAATNTTVNTANNNNQTKRNKRKNFQPRSIAYELMPGHHQYHPEEEQEQQEQEEAEEKELFQKIGDLQERRSSASSNSSVDYALDLTNNDIPPSTNNAKDRSSSSAAERLFYYPEHRYVNNNSVSAAATAIIGKNYSIPPSPASAAMELDDEEEEEDSDRDQGSRHERIVFPMDLSSSSQNKSTADSCCYSDDDSESEDVVMMEKGASSEHFRGTAGQQNFTDFSSANSNNNNNNNNNSFTTNNPITGAMPPQSAFFFPTLHHIHHKHQPFFTAQPVPTEATDLKEYAQNTVKELLEIYGLNGDAVTDVTQTITNNVPISNFNSGKILNSLMTAQGKLLIPRSGGPTAVVPSSAVVDVVNCGVPSDLSNHNARNNHRKNDLKNVSSAVADSIDDVRSSSSLTPLPGKLSSPPPPLSPRSVSINSFTPSNTKTFGGNYPPPPTNTLVEDDSSDNNHHFDIAAAAADNSNSIVRIGVRSGCSSRSSSRSSVSSSGGYNNNNNNNNNNHLNNNNNNNSSATWNTDNNYNRNNNNYNNNHNNNNGSFRDEDATDEEDAPPTIIRTTASTMTSSSMIGTQTYSGCVINSHNNNMQQQQKLTSSTSSTSSEMCFPTAATGMMTTKLVPPPPPPPPSGVMFGGVQTPPTLATATHRMVLPQNMAAILALASMKEQIKLVNNATDMSSRSPLSPAMSLPSSTASNSTAYSDNNSPGGISITRIPMNSPPLMKDGKPLSSPTAIDYSRYVKRFSTSAECGSSYCKDLNFREHFHCLDCNSRVFMKKEEMIRHFKWHKKRDESLQHGFMRYSPSDDCSDRFRHCTHNRKQTHYHCIQGTCDKVYISTSDVQMHANYHRKDSAIIQEGFQRLRATEECRTPYCAFYGQRTTHFHCRRDQCQFTFKNKADMEKHKTYHIKDEQLARDGFKKFLKPDACGFPGCRFSQVCNHIHCVRDGCSYVLHSSGQLLSHKRKHERKDTEIAYRKFKLSQQNISNLINSEQVSVSEMSAMAALALSPSGNSSFQQHFLHTTGASPIMAAPSAFSMLQDNSYSNSSSEGTGGGRLSPTNGKPQQQQQSSQHFTGLPSAAGAAFALNTSASSSSSSSASSSGSSSGTIIVASSTAMPSTMTTNTSGVATVITSANALTTSSSLSQSGGFFTENSSSTDFPMDEPPDCWYRYINHYQCQDSCVFRSKCLLHGTEHYHCKEPVCGEFPFRSKEMAESHARMHEAHERLTDTLYQDSTTFCQEGNCPREKHYHCTWEGCYEAILPNERLEHLRNHEITTSQYNSLDALFRRKRGRPPKNRIIEVWNDYSGIPGNDSPQAIFTSFKLPKPSFTSLANHMQHQSTADSNDACSPSVSRLASPKHLTEQLLEQHKFEEYTDGCPDPLCAYSTLPIHYHCRRPRCFFAADIEEEVITHSTDFHENIDILDGFLFFDSSVDCRSDNCPSNKISRHFHCVHPGCGYSFVRYNNMTEHLNEHQLSDSAAAEKSIVAEKEHDEDRSESESVEKPQRGSSCSPSLSSQIQPTSKCDTPTSSLHSPSSEPTSSRSTTVVKASGTFYPLCGLNNTRSSSPASVIEDKSKIELATSDHEMTVSSPSAIPEWLQAEKHERYTTEKPCCRAFCKLKRKDHYHCNACNQAFSELEKLKPHILKHNTNTLLPMSIKHENNNNNNNEDAENIHSPVIGSSTHMDTSEAIAHGYSPNFSVAMAAAQHLALITSQAIPFIPPHAMSSLYTSPPGLMFAAPPGFNTSHHAIISNGLLDSMQHNQLSSNDSVSCDGTLRRSCSPLRDMSPEMKKARIQNSMRILKDEPVPEGYLRFRFNEDCHYTHCGYREHQTHFHCIRHDCGYSFCDKTRFVQHTARHERLDTLMGGDFQQYRANISCGRSDCVYTNSIAVGQNKASHFHCLKCEFVCTDTNKVVAHRRQHQKLDSIMAAGFEKFTPSQLCSQPDTCVHSGKQTHYHCLSCQYAVLGLSQMTAHKYRHLE